MKKNLFFGMFAATGMLLATSCSNDELNAVQSGNEAQVTFSLGLEGSIASRAIISDGTKADKLVYAVYKLDKDGNPVLQNVVGSENGQFVKTDFKSGDNVSITLAKGQTYQVAFWAQDGDCKAYNTDDLTAVSVSYKAENGTDDALNNDELRDAFFKTVKFTVSGDKTIDVVLKRPFAQINVGVTEEDWNAAVASGIKVKNSAVVIKNAANEINLLTGAVKGNETVVTYASGTIPEETLYVETDATKEGKEAYKWLSMSYILVADETEADVDNDGTLGDASATLQGLQYTFTPESGNAIEFKEGLAGAPVQRNWRTNILGKILTGDIQFNITVDPAYDDDYIYPGTNETTEQIEQLKYVASFGGTATMTENVDFEGDALDINADGIFNMNGFELVAGSSTDYGIRVNNGSTATINGANINSKGGGIGVAGGSNVVYNGGSLAVNTESTSGRYNFYVVGGSTATINGGNFSFSETLNQKRAYIYVEEGSTVYVKGGTFGKASTRSGYTAGIMGNGKVVITGGTFGFDPTIWVADGYKVETKNGKYIVFAKGSTTIANADELTNAISGENGSIQVSSAIDYEDKQIKINNNVVLDMQNNEIKAGSATAYGLVVDGAYAEFNNANINSLGGGIGVVDGSNVVYNGGSLAVNTESTSGRYNFYVVGGSTATINGGNFSFSETLNQKRAYIYVEEGSTVYVKGGTFGKASTRSGYTAGIMGNGKVIITGGTFGFDPSNWLASGYTVTESNGTWTVSAN